MEEHNHATIKKLPLKTLLVLYSYHHQNTAKIAEVFAKVLEAPIKTPVQIRPAELPEYRLIGFGSGIYSAKHHQTLLDLADTLPLVTNQKAFIFSTSALVGKAKVAQDHAALRQKLEAKGYIIVAEFSCKGFNTNSFLKFFGGMNKGRPNAEDLKHAAEFAQSLRPNHNS